MIISYENYRWNNKIRSGFFYLLIGSALFALQEVVISYFHQSGLLGSRFLFTVIFATIIPLVVIWAGHAFNQMVLDLDNVLIFTSDIQEWTNDRIKKTFSYSTWQSRVWALTATVVLSILVLLSPLKAPYSSSPLNVAILLLSTPLMIIAGHSGFVVLASMFTLYKLAELPVKPQFYRAGDTATLPLTRWCTNMILVVVALYLLFLFAIWLTPYFIEPIIIIFMITCGVFPLIFMLWSYYHIHNLMAKIKIMSVDLASQQVQVAYKQLQKKPSKENADWLEKTMQIQNIAESYKEWPNSLQTVSTLFLTLLLPFSQIIVQFLSKPP